VTPLDVAREARRLAQMRHLSFAVEIEHDRASHDGHTYAWLSSGYGVSLIGRPDDAYPELLAVRRDGTGWHVSHAVVAHVGNREVRTDSVGNLRNVTPDMVCALLGVMAWWNEGRDWRRTVVGSTG